MEMGKLTAKLRDAVPVCFLVEGKEVKRYKNIEIPDELKMLEYQGFKFDVPLNGAITFKIMFAPGVLPEEFPKTRERRTRQPLSQGTEPQEAQPAEALPPETVEAPARAPADTQAAGREPVTTLGPENTETTVQPESDAPAKKSAPKGKGKKGAVLMNNADK